MKSTLEGRLALKVENFLVDAFGTVARSKKLRQTLLSENPMAAMAANGESPNVTWERPSSLKRSVANFVRPISACGVVPVSFRLNAAV
ncbi:hypothetical protein [Pararhizobium sp. PWRC1-1]|uniref:hypothetical protein n=1 Tax=Pararhizobium sp. PWRC1-1 TaxID=2804566 RepID=UPI003CFB4379